MPKKLLQFGRITYTFMVSLLLLSACQAEGNPNENPDSHTEGSLESVAPVEGSLTVDPVQDHDLGDLNNLPADNHSIQISNSMDEEESASSDKPAGSSQDSPPAHLSNKDEPDILNKKLSLLGMHIHDSKTAIILKFGKADHSYIIEDLDKPITVYDYDYFSVGFDPKHQLEFIEIRSREIDPQLNGLLLGDSINAAREALGEPHTSSSFVLSYRNSDTILKLDIDPASDTILSIKLFSAM